MSPVSGNASVCSVAAKYPSRASAPGDGQYLYNVILLVHERAATFSNVTPPRPPSNSISPVAARTARRTSASGPRPRRTGACDSFTGYSPSYLQYMDDQYTLSD